MSRYLTAHAAIDVARKRDTIRECGFTWPIVVTLTDGSEVEGTVAYRGIMAFGLRSHEGGLSTRSIKYSDVEDIRNVR